MFDATFYRSILEAIYKILQNNQQRLGKPFCNEFLSAYDPSNGPAAQNNAQQLYNYVVAQAQGLNGGRNEIRDTDQLFQIVGAYIEGVAMRVAQQQQQQQGNQGFGGGFSSPTIGNGGFNNGGTRSMFSNGQAGFGQQQRPFAGSHLGGDEVAPAPQPAPPSQAPSPLPFGTTTAVPTSVVPARQMVKYADNPLDNVPDTGIEFMPVPKNPVWGDDKAIDRRILIIKREQLKVIDDRFQINRTVASHQLIMNDPVEVLKDFFKIIPDSTLGTPFLFRINYNHLDVIDVPTDDFVTVRKRCIEAIAHDNQTLLHKTIMEVLNTMQRGPWKAMTTYLVGHVNRALHLACRTSTNPKLYIKIDDFEDLDTLLSSSFQHPFVAIPEGRLHLEKIVGTALWNAIVMNSDVMFTDDKIPTNAMVSSPAFPFSIEGVYPNKYAIPTSEEASAGDFKERLKTHELSKRSYVLSKRMVTVTNILGKKVLPNIGPIPSVITNPIATLLNTCAIPFAALDMKKQDLSGQVIPNVSEAYPSDQLSAYYADAETYEDNEVASSPNNRPTMFPVDQTMFAIQYGVSPEKYLMALDVFTTIDAGLNAGQVILGKRDIPTLRMTV